MTTRVAISDIDSLLRMTHSLLLVVKGSELWIGAVRGQEFDLVATKPQKVVKIVASWVKRGYCGWKWGSKAL